MQLKFVTSTKPISSTQWELCQIKWKTCDTVELSYSSINIELLTLHFHVGATLTLPHEFHIVPLYWWQGRHIQQHVT